jgi:hypothetical protein
VTLGLATAERECGKYFNGWNISTNADGRFVLQNVPSGMKFQLFGLMDSLRNRGAAFRTDFTSPSDGGSLDLGELAASPACRLQGRIMLADGKSLPPKTRLMIDRAAAWDTTLVPVQEDGSFEVSGVPAELIHLNLQLPNYRFAATNPNLDPASTFCWNRASRRIGMISNGRPRKICSMRGKPPCAACPRVESMFGGSAAVPLFVLEGRQRLAGGVKPRRNQQADSDLKGRNNHVDTPQFRPSPMMQPSPGCSHGTLLPCLPGGRHGRGTRQQSAVATARGYTLGENVLWSTKLLYRFPRTRRYAVLPRLFRPALLVAEIA